MEKSASPDVPFEWIEKTYFFAVDFGLIRIGKTRLRTRQLWTAFPACFNYQRLPPVCTRDLDGVDAVWIPGFPVSRNFPTLQFPPGLIQYMTVSDTRFLVSISGTFNAYLKSKSGNRRSKLKQKIRRWGLWQVGKQRSRNSGARFKWASSIRLQVLCLKKLGKRKL